MDERDALALIGSEVGAAGDDAAVVGDRVVTTDMLHETTDFPSGLTRYSVGWRAVAASLSDVAAMGAAAEAAVAVYAAPSFDAGELRAFVRGAREVCAAVDASYVGGDLDDHEEFTVATTALGVTTAPVLREGATPGEAVCVTGRLGRTAGALRLFQRGDDERANRLFRFTPRIAAGQQIAAHATAMLDSSDGLARSLHQLAEAGDHGVSLSRDAIPIHPVVTETTDNAAERHRQATTVGEDFELVFTAPDAAVSDLQRATEVPVTRIGRVTPPDEGLTIDGEPLANEGYGH